VVANVFTPCTLIVVSQSVIPSDLDYSPQRMQSVGLYAMKHIYDSGVALAMCKNQNFNQSTALRFQFPSPKTLKLPLQEYLLVGNP